MHPTCAVVVALVLTACGGVKKTPEDVDVMTLEELAVTPGEGKRVPAKWWQRKLACPRAAILRGSGPPDGLLAFCINEHGAKHGPYTLWHRNGKRSQQGFYRRGFRWGTWTWWDEQGEVERSAAIAPAVNVCVSDAESRMLMGGVAISLVPLGEEPEGRWVFDALTDPQGFAQLDSVPLGTYDIVVIASGRDAMRLGRSAAVELLGDRPTQVSLAVSKDTVTRLPYVCK
jgi:hypothetical protein